MESPAAPPAEISEQEAKAPSETITEVPPPTENETPSTQDGNFFF